MAVYAREVFIKQPNRLFVYAPIMTGKTIRVLQFDRSGVQVSRTIDYHQKPIFFIMLIVLFSSLDEALIGYDTSTTWRAGRCVITMFDILDQNGKVAEDPQPLFARRTIRSRGTVCWRVRYGNRELLVKDYWGVDARVRESEFLKELAGIKGIGQMFAFTNERYSTFSLRGFKAGSRVLSDTQHLVPNRVFTRLALQMYGLTLNAATSARQLLCRHRDAFLQKDILNRDISFNNLLLASRESDSGVLIDFDMAKKMQAISATTEGDSRTGTRAYQSFKVLLQDNRLGHHDHMDDLESIYYVLFFCLLWA
ncbi:hypothetical protein B0H19DRAFT_932671 [Mycena capillaripes]|nr:hypothetical protein B0H19DRAFT_932671 [Mycena capillaripes]